MGMKQLPKRSGEYLFEVIMRRHDVRSTMMTSNRPLEEWGKLLNDVPSETAILDRFLHHSDVIEITGRSYRMGNSEKIQTVPKRQPGREPNTLRSNGTTMAKVPSISPTGTVWGANGWYCLRRQLTVILFYLSPPCDPAASVGCPIFISPFVKRRTDM